MSTNQWDVQQIGKLSAGTSSDPRVELPKALILPGDKSIAVIVSREFGGDGIHPNAGQAVAVEARLGATSASWGTPGLLTSGSQMAWQIAASGGGAGESTPLSLVGVTTAPPASSASAVRAAEAGPKAATANTRVHVIAQTDGQGVFGMNENTTGTDLGISAVVLSNPMPLPGTPETVTVDVSNSNLQPVSTALGGHPMFEVDLYKSEIERSGPLSVCPTSPANPGNPPPGFLASQLSFKDVLFNQTVPLSFTYTTTGAPESLLACLYFSADLSTKNNQMSATVGALPAVTGVTATRNDPGRCYRELAE